MSEDKDILIEVGKIMEPYPVYAVGGCVRDHIRGKKPKDYDFATPATPDQIEELVRKAGRKPFLVGKRFGTIGCKVLVNEVWHEVEITTFRSESYEEGNRKPNVEFVSDIVADLSRRDFTINAMALRVVKNRLKLIDPFGGEEDIKNGILKCVGFPKQRFKEDPLRILRAIRFATKYNMQIEAKTSEKLAHCVPRLLDISKERWMLELDQILLLPLVARGLMYLWDYKVFNWLIPELSLQKDFDQNNPNHSFPLHVHTSLVVEKTPEDINMRWAALLHDIAKPFTQTYKVDTNGTNRCNYISHEILGGEMAKRIALHLKWSNERTDTVTELVRNHMNEDSPLREYDNASKTY